MSFALSKTRYCNAVQCPKMLWLQKHKPEEFDDSVMNRSVLTAGNEVGDLAMGLFGAFTEVPFSNDLNDMLRDTQKLIDAGTPVITEASFSYDGCFCSVDILKNLGGGRVEIYEVKSSTSVHEIYKHDTAYQYYVLRKLGYEVQRVCLVHLNRHYVRTGELDLQQLFEVAELTDFAAGSFGQTAQHIRSLRAYMEYETEQECEIGEHCSSPCSCGFWSHCTAGLPSPNIFDVAGVQSRTKWKNFRRGIVSFPDILAAKAVNASAMMQVEHELTDLPDRIDRAAIADAMDALSYPLYFLDFESFDPAVPPYDNCRPFQQIVFQYSLHFIEQEGGALQHREFLAMPGSDPRRAVAEQLCRDIPLNVCTTAYNKSFEQTRIRELAGLFPDLSAHLMNIHDNIRDLMVPFQKKWYYTRAMQGSYSIKYVLPALFPNDPSLDYHSLEGVHNGAEASDTFKRMALMSPEELEEYRGHLLRYCGLDTYAMVKVWQKLLEAAGRPLSTTY